MLQHFVFHCVFQTDIKFRVLEAKHQEEKLKLQQRHDGDVEKVRLKTVESGWFHQCMWMEVLSWLWPEYVIIVVLMLKSEVGMLTISYYKVAQLLEVIWPRSLIIKVTSYTELLIIQCSWIHGISVLKFQDHSWEPLVCSSFQSVGIWSINQKEAGALCTCCDRDGFLYTALIWKRSRVVVVGFVLFVFLWKICFHCIFKCLSATCPVPPPSTDRKHHTVIKPVLMMA